MELFIVTYQGGVLLARNVIDGLQPLESNKYQVEFDPGGRETWMTFDETLCIINFLSYSKSR